MQNFTIVEGNITNIESLHVFNPDNINVILNNVNCQGRMGAGINFHLKERYNNLERPYIDFVNQVDKTYRRSLLGQVLTTQVNQNTHVFNVFGQQFYGSDKRHLSYDALHDALERVAAMIGEGSPNIDIYMPYMLGCDRAGGNTEIVKAIVAETIGRLQNNIYAIKFVPAHKQYEGQENYEYYKQHMLGKNDAPTHQSSIQTRW